MAQVCGCWQADATNRLEADASEAIPITPWISIEKAQVIRAISAVSQPYRKQLTSVRSIPIL